VYEECETDDYREIMDKIESLLEVFERTPLVFISACNCWRRRLCKENTFWRHH